MVESTMPTTIADLVVGLSGAEGFDDNLGDFDVLREALAATNLTAALADETADLSVFAPTDAAFVQTARDLGVVIDEANAEASALNGIVAAATELAGGDAEAGLALISDILLYHVVAGAQTLAELDAAGAIQPLFPDATLEVNGLKVVDQEPDLPSADVVLSDVETGNGTVQAIDRVLLPLDIDGVSTILGVAEGAGIFTNLLRSLELTGLDDAVAALTDTTVFAPTDAAFAALAADLGYAGDPNDPDAVFAFIAGALTDLAEDGDPIPLLTNILLYHVAPGAQSAAELGASDSIDNLLGASLSGDGASLSDIASEITDAAIVAPDIAVGDNIIQGLDRVMLPLELQALADILGSAGSDALVGGNADNALRGFGGDDMILGGRGADDIRGNRGADEIMAGLGDDMVRGGLGRDEIAGAGGDDVLRGGIGADDLDGGGGDDTIFGGFGRDTLKGGAGDDALSGGPGADVLDFRGLSGDDTVYVFSDLDAAWFDQSALSDFAALEAASSQDGANLVVTIGDDSVTFLNRSFADLNEDAFLFV